MSKPKIERAIISFEVMRVDGKRYFFGNHGLLSPVPETAFGVISELEVSLNEALKLKSKKYVIDTDNNDDTNNPLGS